jgi:putative membrane protein
MSSNEKTVISLSVLAVLVFAYLIVTTAILPLINIQIPHLPGEGYLKLISVVVLSYFCFAYLRGWNAATVSFIGIFCLAWIVEFLSIHTGIPGGFYYYTSNFSGGPDLLNTPILLGFYYFGYYFFPAYFLSNLLVDGVPFTARRTLWKRALFISFIGGVMVSGIDMLADPMAVVSLHNWVWTTTLFNGYYGIPLSNYIGYIIVLMPAIFVFKYYEIKTDAKPIGPVTIGITAVPFVLILILYAMYVALGPGGMALIGFFTMILPLILCIDKLLIWFKNTQAAIDIPTA